MNNPFELVYASYRTNTKLDVPVMVDVELTNQCNLQCEMCPTGNRLANRKKGFMSGNVWHILLEQLAEHQIPVRFVRWGEPTLHKNLYKWIAEAKDEDLLTHINTNGVLLDIEEVIACDLDSIKFSIHKEIDVVNKLYHRPKRPYMTVTGYEGSIEGYKADEVTVGKIIDLTTPATKYKPCSEVLAKLSINWDGTVSACCADYDDLMIVGDIKDRPLMDIWNSHEMAHYRHMLKKMKHNQLALCRNCKI